MFNKSSPVRFHVAPLAAKTEAMRRAELLRHAPDEPVPSRLIPGGTEIMVSIMPFGSLPFALVFDPNAVPKATPDGKSRGAGDSIAQQFKAKSAEAAAQIRSILDDALLVPTDPKLAEQDDLVFVKSGRLYHDAKAIPPWELYTNKLEIEKEDPKSPVKLVLDEGIPKPTDPRLQAL